MHLHIITVWIPSTVFQCFFFLFLMEGRKTVGNLAGIYFQSGEISPCSAGAHGMNNCSLVGNVYEFQ